MAYDLEKEKQEAIDAGYRALRSLSEAKENLNSAGNWGIVDMLAADFHHNDKRSKMDQRRVIWIRQNMI